MMKNERKRTFLLITLPILALFICFNTVPLIRGVVYSFTNFKGFGTFDWVGLRNYIDLFQDSRVGGSYLFTFKLAIVSTIVTNVIGLMLALGLNSKIRATGPVPGAVFPAKRAGRAGSRLCIPVSVYLHSARIGGDDRERGAQFQYAVQ